ncbi:MAG: hypothetical protein NVSMB25_01950 [Thermoleophilaceae bacterium]
MLLPASELSRRTAASAVTAATGSELRGILGSVSARTEMLGLAVCIRRPAPTAAWRRPAGWRRCRLASGSFSDGGWAEEAPGPGRQAIRRGLHDCRDRVIRTRGLSVSYRHRVLRGDART